MGVTISIIESIPGLNKYSLNSHYYIHRGQKNPYPPALILTFRSMVSKELTMSTISVLTSPTSGMFYVTSVAFRKLKPRRSLGLICITVCGQVVCTTQDQKLFMKLFPVHDGSISVITYVPIDINT